ncbi:unnamed protein product [Haemonchus placei]|uniref:Conjugal transfer protein n=1 Tax=Haemonchus placei TaxID=6290 RepID=A0A0N4W3Z3_HAEPC|nr:unnamed protein product [Haemonchus placei]
MILFDKVALPEYFTNLWQWDVEWEEDNPDYRCLLGRVHVVNAAKVLLWFELLAVPLYILFLFPWWIIFIGPHLVIIILTLYALKKEKHRWMWPINLYAVFHTTRKYFEAKAEGAAFPTEAETGVEKLMRPI